MHLHVLHFVLVAAWIGVLGAEAVLELVPLRESYARGERWLENM